MKNKKSIILIISIIIIIISVISGALIIKKSHKSNQEELMKFAETTKEQRMTIDNFLQKHQYISYMEDFTEEYISNTDLVKAAIYSDDVEQELIVEEDIMENELLVNFEAYKKSIVNIEKYSKEMFNQENLELNFVDTYYNDSGYLIINDKYVFFSKQELPEKIYIAVTYQIENNNYEVQIYEYDVTESNKENLIKMLETGEINKEIAIANRYTLTGQIENNNIKIETKTTF